MKEADKKKWVDALRSGNYRQTTKVLRGKDDEGHEAFCCLGVACEIFGVERVGTGYYDSAEYKNCMTDVLPKALCNRLGIDPEGTFQYKTGKTGHLTDLNDKGYSFKQLANIIERYF